MQPEPVVLWAHPRSMSTVFERVFLERGDFEVFHEPLSLPFFFGPDRVHPRFRDVADAPPAEGYDEVVARIMAPVPGKRRFVKDLAFHLWSRQNLDWLEQVQHAFIIREPRAALYSLHRMLPDFDELEAGYEALHWLFCRVVGSRGKHHPIVIDAASLCAYPERILRKVCERLGVPHRTDAMSWNVREVPEWAPWREWHERATASTHIEATSVALPSVLPERVEALADRYLPIFRELEGYALTP